MLRMRFASSELTEGRPFRPRRDLQVQKAREALPVPANHCLRANNVERLAPPWRSLREPHPEGTFEAPQPRSHRVAAEQDELLPERQVLELKVGVGPERRAQGAQECQYEGHCLQRCSPLSPYPAPGSTFGKGQVVAQHRFVSWFSLALTLALGLPILLAPSHVHWLFRRALGLLFLW